MTLTPPRFPEPATDQRTFLHPPLNEMGSPISGLAANKAKNEFRSSSVQIFLASSSNAGVSMIVKMVPNIRHWRSLARWGTRVNAALSAYLPEHFVMYFLHYWKEWCLLGHHQHQDHKQQQSLLQRHQTFLVAWKAPAQVSIFELGYRILKALGAQACY